MANYDVVVLGGGHNGLIMTCYLAKAGLKVCLLEAYKKVGGGVMTEELGLKGFKHDPFSSHQPGMLANPMISRDELGLQSKYGLKYNIYSPGNAFIFPDDSVFIHYADMAKTCESIAQFSKKDADAFPKFMKWCGEMQVIFSEYLFNPPPPFGGMLSFLEASEQGQEYLKLLFSSALDAAGDWFESPQLTGAIIRSAGESLASPAQKGTGSYVFWFAGGSVAVFPEGGSGALTEKLSACAKDLGATIMVSSPVKSVKVQGGEAKGVILESGEEITASKAVISSLNVKQLFLKLMNEGDVPAEFQEKIRRIRRGKFVTTKQNFSLNEPLKWKLGGDLDRTACVRMMPLVDDMLRIFNELDRGFPQTRDVGVGTPTLLDPTRAPEGKHTAFIWMDEPSEPRDGGAARWNTLKNEVMDGGFETLKSHVTNLTDDNVLERFSMSPTELEEFNPTWLGGDANHIGLTVGEIFSNRPMPGWGQYKTPVKNLYMCGASTHPGPAVIGGARAAVPLIMEYLGIKFDKVIK